MKKLAKELKKGDTIMVAGKKMKIEAIEHSDAGKQGAKKCRLEVVSDAGEKTVLIRPEDYPFEKL